MVSFKSGKAKHRKSVGVRMPDEPVTRVRPCGSGSGSVLHAVRMSAACMRRSPACAPCLVAAQCCVPPLAVNVCVCWRAQALLEAFGGCLLSHSVHVPESLGEGVEVPDPGTLLDLYAHRGLDFIVDVGHRTVTATTVRARACACDTQVRVSAQPRALTRTQRCRVALPHAKGCGVAACARPLHERGSCMRAARARLQGRSAAGAGMHGAPLTCWQLLHPAAQVVDLTSGEPEVLRVGKGDVSAFAS